MLDIKFVRENPDVVKENIRKKFQDAKLPLVDEVIALDKENREIKQELQSLQADRNRISKSIGKLMHEGKKEEAEQAKEQVTKNQERVAELSAREKNVEEELKKIHPSMEIEEVESAVREHELTDMTDIMAEMLRREKENKELCSVLFAAIVSARRITALRAEPI